MGDTLCLLSSAPFGSGQPRGFLTGYLIGCAVLIAVLGVELMVLVVL
jgi:hypothetical protein